MTDRPQHVQATARTDDRQATATHSFTARTDDRQATAHTGHSPY